MPSPPRPRSVCVVSARRGGHGSSRSTGRGGYAGNDRTVPVTVGKDVQEMLENDLSQALEGWPVLQRASVLCLEQADTGSRELLEHLLVSAEEHVEWLEVQVSLIKTVGYENYCAQHIQPT